MTEYTLQPASQHLWAKKARDGSPRWLPLALHLADCACTARLLWKDWVPEGLKQQLASGIEAQSLEEAGRLFVFFCAAHDLGKAIPSFQCVASYPRSPLDGPIADGLASAGFAVPKASADMQLPRHAVMGQLLLAHQGLNHKAAAVVGPHHGQPADDNVLDKNRFEKMPEHFGHARDAGQAFIKAQQDLLGLVLALSGYSGLGQVPAPKTAAQMLYAGLVIVADWVASSEELFPLYDWGAQIDPTRIISLARARAQAGFAQLALPKAWQPSMDWASQDLYAQRFLMNKPGFMPRPAQLAALTAIKSLFAPGILVLEAPMGLGKTEIALAIAEVFAQMAGRSGLFFALPTQATGDAMFFRVHAWAKRLVGEEAHSIRLAHGKAQFNQEYQRLFDLASSQGQDAGGLGVHSWFSGQKKSLLADFVVGTVDQLLFAALRQKHVMLRHLGLANKVVVVDEVHAYDAYMNRYLMRALTWLGRYQVPVILLSATLPAQRRSQLVAAYLNMDRPRQQARLAGSWQTCQDYPLLTYTQGDQVCQQALPLHDMGHAVEMDAIGQDDLPAFLQQSLAGGGCVGVLRNTVQAAQQTADELRQALGCDQVVLLHSRFLAPHRSDIEQDLMQALGKPGQGKRPERLVVVGTQVLEQSLDIDFDLLITDLCPMDLLLQRLGRLHRHARQRPEALKTPRCLVLGLAEEKLDEGSRAIYGDYLLWRTRALLPQAIRLPEDIPGLVQACYDSRVPLQTEPPGYAQMLQKWQQDTENKEDKAEGFLLPRPSGEFGQLLSFQQKDERAAQASVRDGDESIEVLMLQEDPQGLHIFGQPQPCFPHSRTPASQEAELLARQRIRLPASLCYPGTTIRDTIAQLEASNQMLAPWQDSPWLKGELVLILDENGQTLLNNHQLCYDRQQGLTDHKIEN